MARKEQSESGIATTETGNYGMSDGRSAADHPAIENEGDLERVTSRKKPRPQSGQSSEAKEQIET